MSLSQVDRAGKAQRGLMSGWLKELVYVILVLCAQNGGLSFLIFLSWNNQSGTSIRNRFTSDLLDFELVS